MEKKVTYTLMLDWHAAGIATVLMSLVFLSASFPWGSRIYSILMTNFGPKTLFAPICGYFFVKAALRSLLATIWLLIVPARRNIILSRLVCAPFIARRSDVDIRHERKTAWVQYVFMVSFLLNAVMALLLSVPAALGANFIFWINGAVLILGLSIAVAAIAHQYRARSPRFPTTLLVRF